MPGDTTIPIDIHNNGELMARAHMLQSEGKIHYNSFREELLVSYSQTRTLGTHTSFDFKGVNTTEKIAVLGSTFATIFG